MNILELFGIFFSIEIALIVITIITSFIFGIIGKYQTRKNYLDIMKLDGDMRKKQAEYFESHPEEYEKWKAINAMNEAKATEKQENSSESITINQEKINEILRNAIQK